MSYHLVGNEGTFDGHWVRAQRRRIGLHQHQLAARLAEMIDEPNGVNQGRISEIENGQRAIKPDWLNQFKEIFEN